MLTQDDRDAIDGLFRRLEAVEHQAPTRDDEAEALIARRIAAQAGAPYYMAQTILVQERALEEANQRIEELERGLNRPNVPSAEPRLGPWDRPQGFLAGAAQTALGVSGGLLLGSAIAGLFGAGGATAAEPAPAETGADDPGAEVFDDGGSFDFGGDF